MKKMANEFVVKFSNVFFGMENLEIWITFNWNKPKGRIHNKSAMVQVIAWWLTGFSLLLDLVACHCEEWWLSSFVDIDMHFENEYVKNMMTSSNGNIFCVTGPLWGESTGHRWIPLTKASDVQLWCFLWSAPEQTIEQTIKTPVIWDAIMLIMMSL